MGEKTEETVKQSVRREDIQMTRWVGGENINGGGWGLYS